MSLEKRLRIFDLLFMQRKKNLSAAAFERPFAVGSVRKKIFQRKQAETNGTCPSADRRERIFCVRSGTRKSFALDPAHRARCIRGCARNCKAAPNIFGKAPLARLAQLPVLPRLFPTREPRSSESKEKIALATRRSLPASSHHQFLSIPQEEKQAARKIQIPCSARSRIRL